MTRTVHASDCRCCRCGIQAVVFWPVIDPDIEGRSYCRACVEEAKVELMVEMFDPEPGRECERAVRREAARRDETG